MRTLGADEVGLLPDEHAINYKFEAVADQDGDGTVLGYCGTGKDTQPMPLEKPNPGLDPLFDAFAPTDEDAPEYSAELNDLVERTNKWFREEAEAVLRPFREKTPDLMLTWWFGPNGRQLAFARPHAKPKIRFIDTSVLRLLWRKLLLFFGWRPRSARRTPSTEAPAKAGSTKRASTK